MVYLFDAGFWSNLNAFAISLFSLGLYVAFAHFLTKEQYGTYQYLLSFFSIATGFTLTGMNTAVTRAVAQGKEGTMRASVPLQIKYGAIPLLGALLFSFYYWHAGNTTLALGLVTIGVFTPLLYAYNSFNSLFMGRKDFRTATLLGVAGNVFYYGLLALAAILSGSPLIILAVNLGVQTLIYLVLYLYTLRHYKPNNEVDEEALAYGLHLSGLGAFASVAAQMGNVFIFHFLGPVPLALYAFASAVPERLGNLSFKFLGSALLPKFAERDVHAVRKQILSKMLWAFAAGAVIALCYITIAPFFFMLFFPAYVSAIKLSMFLAIGLALSAPIYIPMTALTALGNKRGLYIFNIVNPFIYITFPLVGIYFGGLWGYAVTHLLSIIVSVTVLTVLVFKTGE